VSSASRGGLGRGMLEVIGGDAEPEYVVESFEDLSEDEFVMGEERNEEEGVPSDDENSYEELGSDNETLSSDVLFDLDASSDSDSSECELPAYDDGLKAASGRIWAANAPPSSGRQRQANIVRTKEFSVRANQLPEHNNEREILLLFLDHFLAESIRYTNLQGKRMVRRWNIENGSRGRKWTQVDADEMEAFIGLHILAGAFKAQFRSTEELWSERDGQPVFRATMSRERFCNIKGALRFDDPLRRDKEDPLAPIRHVFETFTMKLRQYVESGPHLTVDEQLVEFHGKVKFRQYIASKPGKFGIKIFWVTDAETSYCLNGLVYIGKNSLPEETLQSAMSVPEAVVVKLCKPFLGKGRNVTADNWFSSLPLVERLRDEYTTFVGTVRSNRRDIPPAASSTKGRKRGDTKNLYSDGVLLCSFWDKGTKPVLLVDSYARTGDSPIEGNKPKTVLFYNETKSGVDNLDHMVRLYSTKRKCRRWPYSIAMNLVDIAAVNGTILLKHLSQRATGKYQASHVHYDFLKKAGYQLIDRHIQRRLSLSGVRGTVLAAAQLLGYTQNFEKVAASESHSLTKQKRCQFCNWSKDRKTKTVCSRCGRAMCSDHRACICLECSK
jgi:hypothetical protein